jgi:hypothetical protein
VAQPGGQLRRPWGAAEPPCDLDSDEQSWHGSQIKNHPKRAKHDRPRNAARIGLKPKDLIGIPWRVAFALQADGWYLRQDIIWSKPNPMPESVTDRCTKAHEYLFLLSKGPRYHYDGEAIAEAALGPVGEGTATGTGSQHKQSAIGQNGGKGWLGANHGNSQPPLRLDGRHPAIQRGAFRDLPARADRALHPRRMPERRHRARSLLWRRHNRPGGRSARPQLPS